MATWKELTLHWKFSTGNYSTAGKKGHWLASKDISLPHLPYLTL